MPTAQQNAIAERGRATGECYAELSEKYKSFDGKFVAQKKTGTMRSPGKKLYMCVEKKLAGK